MALPTFSAEVALERASAAYRSIPAVHTLHISVVPQAAGLCVLKQNPNGTYYCEKGTCSGSCTLHNWPTYCSCD